MAEPHPATPPVAKQDSQPTVIMTPPTEDTTAAAPAMRSPPGSAQHITYPKGPRRAFVAVLLALVDPKPQETRIIQVFFEILPALAVVVEWVQLMALVGIEIFAIPDELKNFLSVFSINFPWLHLDTEINITFFYCCCIACAVNIILIAIIAFFFARGRQTAPGLVLSSLRLLTRIVATFFYLPVLRVMFEQFYCTSTYCATWWQMLVAVIGIIVHVSISTVVVANAYTADPNAFDLTRRHSTRFDMVNMILKSIATLATVFVRRSSSMAVIIIIIILAALYVLFLHLIQPYWWLPMTRFRSGLFAVLFGWSISALICSALNLKDLATASMIMLIPVIPMFLFGYFSVRESQRSWTVNLYLSNLFSRVELGHSAEMIYTYHLESLLNSPQRLGQYANFLSNIMHDDDEAEIYYDKANKYGMKGGHVKDFGVWQHRRTLGETDFLYEMFFLDYVIYNLQMIRTMIVVKLNTAPKFSTHSLLFHWRRRIHNRAIKMFWYRLPTEKPADVEGSLPMTIQRLLWSVLGGERAAKLSLEVIKCNLTNFLKRHPTHFTARDRAILIELATATEETWVPHDLDCEEVAHALVVLFNAITSSPKCTLGLMGHSGEEIDADDSESVVGGVDTDDEDDTESLGHLGLDRTESTITDDSDTASVNSIGLSRATLAAQKKNINVIVLIENAQNKDLISRRILDCVLKRCKDLPIMFIVQYTPNPSPQQDPSSELSARPVIKTLARLTSQDSLTESSSSSLGSVGPMALQDCEDVPLFRLELSLEKEATLSPELSRYTTMRDATGAAHIKRVAFDPVGRTPCFRCAVNFPILSTQCDAARVKERLLNPTLAHDADNEDMCMRHSEGICTPYLMDRLKRVLSMHPKLGAGVADILMEFLEVAAVLGRSRPIRLLPAVWHRIGGSQRMYFGSAFGALVHLNILALENTGRNTHFGFQSTILRSCIVDELKKHNYKRFQVIHYICGMVMQEHDFPFYTRYWEMAHFEECWDIPRLVPILMEEALSKEADAFSQQHASRMTLLLLEWLLYRSNNVKVIDTARISRESPMPLKQPKKMTDLREKLGLSDAKMKELRQVADDVDAQLDAARNGKGKAADIDNVCAMINTKNLVSFLTDDLKKYRTQKDSRFCLNRGTSFDETQAPPPRHAIKTRIEPLLDVTTTHVVQVLSMYATSTWGMLRIFGLTATEIFMALDSADNIAIKPEDKVYALSTRARISVIRGDFEKGRDMALQALEMVAGMHFHDPPHGLVNSHYNLGMASRRLRDYPKAIKHYAEASALARRAGDMNVVARSLAGLAMTERDSKNYKHSVMHFKEAMQLFLWIGDDGWFKDSLHGQGLCLTMQGEFAEARKIFSMLFERAISSFHIFHAVTGLSEVALLTGDEELLDWCLATMLSKLVADADSRGQAHLYGARWLLQKRLSTMDYLTQTTAAHLFFKSSRSSLSESSFNSSTSSAAALEEAASPAHPRIPQMSAMPEVVASLRRAASAWAKSNQGGSSTNQPLRSIEAALGICNNVLESVTPHHHHRDDARAQNPHLSSVRYAVMACVILKAHTVATNKADAAAAAAKAAGKEGDAPVSPRGKRPGSFSARGRGGAAAGAGVGRTEAWAAEKDKEKAAADKAAEKPAASPAPEATSGETSGDASGTPAGAIPRAPAQLEPISPVRRPSNAPPHALPPLKLPAVSPDHARPKRQETVLPQPPIVVPPVVPPIRPAAALPPVGDHAAPASASTSTGRRAPTASTAAEPATRGRQEAVKCTAVIIDAEMAFSLMAELKTHVLPDNHKVNLRWLRHVVTGTDVVSYLLAAQHASTRLEGGNLAQSLLEYGLLIPVNDSKMFEDRETYYHYSL